MTENNNQLATQAFNAPTSLTEQFTDVSTIFYSSIANDGTRESAAKIYNAMNAPQGNLSDNIGKEFTVTDVIAHNIELLDEQTGEVIQTTRVVLIDEAGAAWACVSTGVIGSIEKIVGLFGQAPWNPGITIVPNQVKTRKGFKVMTLNVVVK